MIGALAPEGCSRTSGTYSEILQMTLFLANYPSPLFPVLYSLPPERQEQLDQQDQHNGHFQQKPTALVELLNHVLVERVGGPKLLRDEVLVVRHSHLRCGKAIQSRGKHIAQKFDGVVGVFGQLGDLQQHRMQTVGGAGQTPAGQHASPLTEQVVDGAESLREQLVVVAELEQLRVGVLNQLNRRLRAQAAV